MRYSSTSPADFIYYTTNRISRVETECARARTNDQGIFVVVVSFFRYFVILLFFVSSSTSRFDRCPFVLFYSNMNINAQRNHRTRFEYTMLTQISVLLKVWRCCVVEFFYFFIFFYFIVSSLFLHCYVMFALFSCVVFFFHLRFFFFENWSNFIGHNIRALNDV